MITPRGSDYVVRGDSEVSEVRSRILRWTGDDWIGVEGEENVGQKYTEDTSFADFVEYFDDVAMLE